MKPKLKGKETAEIVKQAKEYWYELGRKDGLQMAVREFKKDLEEAIRNLEELEPPK